MTGREVIAELVEELRGSVAAAEQFEGEMRNLAAYAKALAQALDCIRTAGGSRWAIATHPCSQIEYVLSGMGGGRRWVPVTLTDESNLLQRTGEWETFGTILTDKSNVL